MIQQSNDIWVKGEFKTNGNNETRSAKNIYQSILQQGFNEKLRKYDEIANASYISFTPLMFLDTGKLHRTAAQTTI